MEERLISKQLACQKYVYKIHSSRLRKEGWKLTLPLDEARRNDEVISLAESQMLRWIDELNGVVDADTKARKIKSEIKNLRRAGGGAEIRRSIKKLYGELDALQFKPDYLCLIIDKEKDYHRACRGFSINGIRYKRLLGTNGGIKNSTIVFVSEKLWPELSRRVDNGRDMTKELVTAKLEAYKALTCSASVPVSTPNGVLVVNDCETEFFSDILYITDECGGEPTIEKRESEKITLNASDGFGLMLPSLATRWSEELGLNYMISGCNTRFSFEKGMVYTFDFVDFAENVAHNYLVKDAWGNNVDIREVETILTTSMVKLWDSYTSCEEYINNSLKNGYTFAVTKTCPRELENERYTNYQFVQSYQLSDEDIEELIAPTLDEIRGVLGGDWRKAILFLKGAGLNERNVPKLDDDFIKAVMIDRRMLSDPFVQDSIYQLIRNRIDEAKVGVLNIHGNYSIISGDPYLLCQSIFGLEKTGLLRAGEIYNQYWADAGAETLACFRAPMSTHENIRLVHPADNDEVRYWFRYIKTATIFNGWDTATAALNGCDFDGDAVMLTDNRILVEKLIPSPALVCAQRKATKRISVEEDFIRSNIESFGNEIGSTTNRITSMFELRSTFDPDSEEYKELTYRIRAGQLYQQNAIDKAKGIICKPMPRTWHDRHAISAIEDDETREFYRRIAADRKPYFMRYIYPELKRQYNKYIKNTNKNALREFQMTIPELEAVLPSERTERQSEFLHYYYRNMPVGTGDCVMNRICRRFEEEFDSLSSRSSIIDSFDYRFMRGEGEYTPKQLSAVKRIKADYTKRLSNYKSYSQSERIDKLDAADEYARMNEDFLRECSTVCPNESALCNLLLDICYTKKTTKRFVWEMCGETIIRNLLKLRCNEISFPALCSDGETEYRGERFTVKIICIKEDFDDRSERA